MQSRPAVFPVITALLIAALYLHTSVYGMVATGPNGSNAQAVHALGITGAGVNVGLIATANTRKTHEAFFDKDTNYQLIGLSHVFPHNATSDGGGDQVFDIYGHETWVAGVIASRGGTATNQTDIGVAPDVNLYNERVAATTGEINSAFLETALDNLVANNCHVVYTSFQLPSTTTTDGSSPWTLIYDYYADTHNIVFANPVGNHMYNDSNNTVTVFGDAYNGITTGGLSVVEPGNYRRVGYWGGNTGYPWVTNIGLTADLRRKPEVTAPVQNQAIPGKASDTQWQSWTSTNGETSFAVPHTAGVAALLLQYANSTGDTADNENEVIRAVIVNSTFPNIRDNNNVSTTGQIHNVARGYGRIDALRAYQTLTALKISPNTSTTATSGWAYTSIKPASRKTITQTYSIYGTKNERLIVTLTWNRKINRSSFTPYSYSVGAFYNLYLNILDPSGTTVLPSDADTKNNLKKRDILLPTTGTYKVQVKLTNRTSSTIIQDYGLAFEIVPQIPGDFDLNYIVDNNDLLTFANQWLLDAPPALAADLAPPTTGDGHIDFADFAVFAQNWLTANNAYYAGY